MSDLLVCAANFHSTLAHVAMLAESCRFYGLTFGSFGETSPWEGFIKSKVLGLVEYIKAAKQPYVLSTDGWDVWMLADEKTILDLYKSFEKPIVICGHKERYPARGRPVHYPEAPTRFRWVCSGQFIGERKALLETLLFLGNNYSDLCDQGAWNKSIEKGEITSVVEIDHYCKLFLTMAGIPLHRLHFDQERRVVFEETNKNNFRPAYTGPAYQISSKPVSIHFAGGKGGSPNDMDMKSFYETWMHNR